MPEATSNRCCWPDCGRLAHHEDSPPLCTAHLITAATYLKDQVKGILPDYTPPETPLRALPRKTEVVYYVQIHDYVKIGTTSHLAGRMLNLRIEPEQILAVEPGGRELEKQRHQQFVDERRGRREDFEMSDGLMEHIEQVRSLHPHN